MKYLGKLPARKFPDDDAENTTETAQRPVAWIDDPHRPQPHCVTDLKYCSLIDYKAGKHLLYTPLYGAPLTVEQESVLLANGLLVEQNTSLRAEIDRMRAALERPAAGWTLNWLRDAVDKAMGK